MQIHSFHKISKKYKVIFFDSFGVLKNSSGIIKGAQTTFDNLLDKGIDYFILTNDSSRSPAQLSLHFKELGFVHEIPEEKMISSGMMARQFLQHKVKKGMIVYLGTYASASYINDLSLETVPIDRVHFTPQFLKSVSALVFMDDEGFDWKIGINNTVNLLRMVNIPVVVANTDQIYPVSHEDISVAIGGLADLVEKTTGKHFIRFGKPDVQIFNYAYEHINRNHAYQKKDILMVGDTLTTDIIGGNKFGIDTALVLSGNTVKDKVENKIKGSGIIPTYICESIAT